MNSPADHAQEKLSVCSEHGLKYDSSTTYNCRLCEREKIPSRKINCTGATGTIVYFLANCAFLGLVYLFRSALDYRILLFSGIGTWIASYIGLNAVLIKRSTIWGVLGLLFFPIAVALAIRYQKIAFWFLITCFSGFGLAIIAFSISP